MIEGQLWKLRDSKVIRSGFEAALADASFEEKQLLLRLVNLVVEELDIFVGPSTHTKDRVVAGIASQALNMFKVIGEKPKNLPPEIRELVKSLPPGDWDDVVMRGRDKQLEMHDIVRQPQWAHLRARR